MTRAKEDRWQSRPLPGSRRDASSERSSELLLGKVEESVCLRERQEELLHVEAGLTKGALCGFYAAGIASVERASIGKVHPIRGEAVLSLLARGNLSH